MRTRSSILLILCFFSLALSFALSSFAHAQRPFIDAGNLVVPVVKVGDALYRIEFTINLKASPVQLMLASAEIEESYSAVRASALVGSVLTIPKLRLETKNYELKLNLVSENPILFDLISVVEVAENFDATSLVTYSPEVCQVDIELFSSESFQVQEPALGYKGDFFTASRVTVPTSTFTQAALVSKRFGTVLALADTQPPGLKVGARFRSPPSAFTVAPDLGQENDPDYPVLFSSQVQLDGFNREGTLYRSDGKGGLNLVIVSGVTVNLGTLSGEVDGFSGFKVSPDGAVFFILKLLNDDKDYLVKQDKANGGLILLMASGEFINTGSGDSVVRKVGGIEIVSVNVFNQVIVRVEVLDENNGVEGFAYLNTDNTTGSNQCISSDSSILCNGLVTDEESLISISSDGGTTGLLIKTPTGQTLDYKVIANPRDEKLQQNVDYQGYSFRAFKKPQVCESRNALYFVGSFFESPIGAYDELFRIDEFNNLKKITDFKSLLLDPALKGQVPDEVIDWTIGYNCDAVFYMWGPSGPNSSQGYQGHWASYLTGETVELLDETPGRPNGNGAITSVQNSSSNIDSSFNDFASAGAEGEFYFVPRVSDSTGAFQSTYAIATKPNCP